MPPKHKKTNHQDSNEEGEEPFQAVILTDTFEEQFSPVSLEMPKVKRKKVFLTTHKLIFQCSV
jgi:hypothetical protein